MVRAWRVFVGKGQTLRTIGGVGGQHATVVRAWEVCAGKEQIEREGPGDRPHKLGYLLKSKLGVVVLGSAEGNWGKGL